MLKITVLFFLSLFASCQSSTPETLEASLTTRKAAEPVHHVTENAKCIVAIYKDAQFTIYKDGNGAAALIGDQSFDIAGQPFESQAGEWTASDQRTGDYIVLNVATGVTTGKVKGMYFTYLPEG